MDIPELECEIGPSGLGGRFTTVEGILEALKDQIADSSAVFHDSEDHDTKRKMDKYEKKSFFFTRNKSNIQISEFSIYNRFFDSIRQIINGESKATLILNDPAGNSYVQALTDDGSLDERLKIERYVRSFEQNEELGLNDIKTENYS